MQSHSFHHTVLQHHHLILIIIRRSMTMTDEEAAVEVVPLKSRISLQSQSSSRLQRSVSSSPESLDASPSSSPLLQQLLVSLSFVLAAWYIPRYLIANESGIENRPVPYQQTAAKDVILDFRLSEPLVDPPTIPCKLHRTYASRRVIVETKHILSNRSLLLPKQPTF